MKLYAPRYYLEFRCIADKCRHNCCVGWEIDIDEQTLACYDHLDAPYAANIRISIDRQGDTPHFRLGADEHCPHLNSYGLCRIILALGEDYLCDICREHPRFYHETERGLEVGLGMACEEACLLILSSDDYASFVEVGESEGEVECDFDALSHRDRIFAVLSNRSVTYEARRADISRAFGVSPVQYADEHWRQLLFSLEYLDEAHRSLFACYSSDETTPRGWEPVLERALAYFLYRHTSQAEGAKQLCAAIGFSLFCERLLASLIRATKAQELEEVVELARVISEEIEYSEENTREIKALFL